MKKILFLFSMAILFAIPMGLAQSDDGNGGGAIRISFGQDSQYEEPRTLSGDDPAVPPKPKRTFHTNSMILNRVLSVADDWETLNSCLESLQSSEKVQLETTADCADCLTIVYNLTTKEVVAVLDKGNGKRMNLLSNKFETNDLYPNDTFGMLRFRLLE